jgi:predicted DNA-binding transcriptional regulator AlpA
MYEVTSNKGETNMSKGNILRMPAIAEKMGLKKSSIYTKFINTGLLAMKRLGNKSVGAYESDVDALIASLPDLTTPTMEKNQRRAERSPIARPAPRPTRRVT